MGLHVLLSLGYALAQNPFVLSQESWHPIPSPLFTQGYLIIADRCDATEPWKRTFTVIKWIVHDLERDS